MTLIGGYPNPRFRDAFNAANNPDVPLDYERIFVQTQAWGTTLWNEVVNQIKAGRTVIVSTKLTGSWASAATGSNNTRMDKVVDELVKLNITALKGVPCLSFHHEPEGDGTPADYNAMQKYMVTRYAAKLRAAGWDLCIITMGGTLPGWTQWTPAQLDAALAGVDVKRVFSDIYEKPGSSGGYATKPWTDPNSTASPYRKYVDWCKAHGYIAGMPEFAVFKKQGDANFQTAFIDAFAAWPRSGEFETIIYYDRLPGEGGAEAYALISDVPTALRSFAKLYDAEAIPEPEPEPEPEPGDCAEIEAQLKAVTEELVETKADLTEALTHLAETGAELDTANEKIAAAQAALA